MGLQEELCEGILKTIRAASAAGRLVQSQEILSQLKGQGLPESPQPEEETHLETLLKQVLQEAEDIREISGRNGIPYYYSVQTMTDTYAGILVLKAEGPVRLIAEVVRDNSRLYPRPVSAASFKDPPFDLTEEAIQEFLETLGDITDYNDIVSTVTSIGTTFLYSHRHLDQHYATMLAEWIDVGQADNP